MDLGFKIGDTVRISTNGCIGTIKAFSSVSEQVIDCYELGLYDLKDIMKIVDVIVCVSSITSYKDYKCKLIDLTLINTKSLAKYIKKEEEKEMETTLNKKLFSNINVKLNIKSINESTRMETIKIPQYKAAPKIEHKEYKVVTVEFGSGDK